MNCIRVGFISRVSRFFRTILFLSTNCGIVKTFTIVACFCFWTISTDMTLIQTWKTTIAFWRVSLRWWVLTKNHNCCFRYLNLVNYAHAIGYCQKNLRNPVKPLSDVLFFDFNNSFIWAEIISCRLPYRFFNKSRALS